MIKVFCANVIVSKGFGDNPAISFSNNDEVCRFRIGKSVYDSRAKDNTRWINRNVKAFGPLVERIKKMQLKEGAYINMVGTLDDDVWTDKESGEEKSSPVIILADIEYASGGTPKAKTEGKTEPAEEKKEAKKENTGKNPEDSSNFTGYEPFGGGSFFDEN